MDEEVGRRRQNGMSAEEDLDARDEGRRRLAGEGVRTEVWRALPSERRRRSDPSRQLE